MHLWGNAQANLKALCKYQLLLVIILSINTISMVFSTAGIQLCFQIYGLRGFKEILEKAFSVPRPALSLNHRALWAAGVGSGHAGMLWRGARGQAGKVTQQAGTALGGPAPGTECRTASVPGSGPEGMAAPTSPGSGNSPLLGHSVKPLPPSDHPPGTPTSALALPLRTQRDKFKPLCL